MSDLCVVYKKCSGQTEAYKLLCETITLEYVSSFNVKAKITYHEKTSIIEADGKGFNLFIQCEESECHIDSKFSLLLRPIKGKVLSILKKELERKL